MGSARPVRRSTPFGFSTVELPAGRSLPATLLALSRPFRGRPPRVCSTVNRSCGLRRDPDPRSRILSWTLPALRHSVSVVDPHDDGGSLHRRVPRARFGYLLRGIHHWVLRPPAPFGTARLPARQARWSAHGLHSSRVSPRPRAVLLSEPLPSCRYRQLHLSARRRGGSAGSRLQGLVPAASPFSTGASGGKPPSAPAADPVLRFCSSPELAPARSGSRFGRGASPRTLGWGDVPIHPGHRVSGVERVGRPVSGPPALMRFFTFQQTMLRPLQQEGRPKNWMWTRLGACGIAATDSALPSRPRPRSASGHCCPVASLARVGSDKCLGPTTSHCRAATDPGPAARHRHSSVHN
jgi:hypothetical protein